MSGDQAPAWPVYAAAAAVAVAIGTLILTGFATHWLGWVAGSLAATGLVVIYRVLDRRASQRARYVRDRRVGRLANALLVAGILAGSVNAFWIATELAK